MPKPDSAPVFCGEDGGIVCLTDILSSIMCEIAVFSPQFAHIDMGRVLVSAAFNKFQSRGHTYGKLVPLRFENGEKKLFYRGRFFYMPDLFNKGIDQLYVIYFYAPQFFNLPPYEKLKVIFHELYHISPEFNGDIRRMGKKKAAHGHSRKKFDSLFEEEAKRFNKHIANTDALEFLSLSMSDFYKKFKNVTCLKVKTPKAVLVKDYDKT